MEDRIDLLSMTPEEIGEAVAGLGEKPFRAKQIFKWLYRGATDFTEMTDLPKGLIRKLGEKHTICRLREEAKKISSDGHTIKYLFLLPDDHIIECVEMEYHHGITLCLSTQVGCRMRCSFCTSTTGGLLRHLTPGEMCAQVLAVNRALAQRGKPELHGLVLMGSGEPLDNYDNTLKFLRLIHEPDGLNMGYRNITLSTSGLVPRMRDLAEEGIPINLAVSLHASNDRIRREIMPVASAYSIADLMDASRTYFEKTGRRVTFEYALIRGKNDGIDHARELAALLRDFPSHVNVIPLNEVPHAGYKRSSEEQIRLFMEELKRCGVNVTRRRELGLDIEGACGQLKASHLKR